MNLRGPLVFLATGLLLGVLSPIASAQKTPAPAKPAIAEKPAAPAVEKAAVPDKTNAEQEAVVDALEAIITAFNKQDAETLGAGWSPQGVHVAQDTGVRTEGRAAIQKMYANMFAEKDPPKLAVHVTKVHFATSDVAVLDGLANVTTPQDDDEDLSQSTFIAIMVKQQGKWLLDNVRETEVPADPKPADYLEDLAWMVGEWEDESDEVTIKTAVKWSAKKAFLIRSFSVIRADKTEREGTQIFGWDPADEVIRTWVFGSEGGFGQGIVRIDGERLTTKLNGVLPDGRRGSSTQTWTRVDDDTVIVQTIAREVDGEPQGAADPVKVVRVKPATADEKPALDAELPKTK